MSETTVFQSQGLFAEEQRRKEQLSKSEKRLFEQLEKVNTDGYDVTASVVLMVAEIYQNNAINAFNTIFTLGFLKGQSKERARLRKRKNKPPLCFVNAIFVVLSPRGGTTSNSGRLLKNFFAVSEEAKNRG